MTKKIPDEKIKPENIIGLGKPIANGEFHDMEDEKMVRCSEIQKILKVINEVREKLWKFLE